MHSLKTRFIPTAVVLAVLGLGALVFLPQYSKTGNGNGGDRSVVLTVDFIPVQRRDFDGVVVASTGAPTETVRASPWIRTVYLKKGARIYLTPTQYVNGYLRCIISQGPDNFVENERNTPGNLKCRLTVA
jgi:hypothetical protein